MPNRKIKHITATLTGASSAETFDIFDEATNQAVELLKHTNRRFVLLSDSYGMNTDPSWTTIFQDEVPNTVQYSKSSIGFTTVTHANGTFLISLETVANGMTESERALVTDIVVGGGFNDATQIFLGNSSLSSLRAAIVTFANRALELFPNAIVTTAFMGWLVYGAVTTNHATASELDTTRLGYNTTYAKNLKHITGCEYIVMDPTQADDSYFHPNAGDGSLHLFRAVLFKLLGGYPYQYYKDITVSNLILSGDKTITINKFSISGKDDLCVIDMDINVSGTFSNSGTNARVFTLNIGQTPFYSTHGINFIVANYNTKEAYYASLTSSGQFYVYTGTTTLSNAKLVAHVAFSKDMS